MDFNLDEVKVFENYEIVKWEEGEVTLETQVVDSSLNYYGNAHGGYLFTLCDQVSGLIAISTGFEAVTLQSNINYLRAGRLGDKLKVIGTCVHNGRTTKVVDVHIKNENGEMVTTAIFTMFVTGKREK